MDQFYFEGEYVETRYFGYIAAGEESFLPYYESGYFVEGYFPDASVIVTMSCIGGRLQQGASEITGAFSPVIQAGFLINSTAVLDAVFDTSIQAVANRNANVIMDYLAELNAQAAKTASAVLEVSAAVSISITSTKIIQFDSTINSAATLACEALVVQLASASVAAQSSIYASKWVGTQRPREFTLSNVSSQNKAEVVTDLSKFGSGSLRITGAGRYSGVYSKDYTLGSNDFALEAWVYAEEVYTSSTARTLIGVELSGWRLQVRNGDYRFGYFSGTFGSEPNPEAFITSTVEMPTLAWTHLAVVRTGNRLSLYQDGTRVATTTSVAFIGPTAHLLTPKPTFRIAGTDVASDGEPLWYYDEVSLVTGNTREFDANNSSLTVPSAARTNDVYTQVLLHFNGNAEDDVTLTEIASAAVSTTAQVTAAAQRVVDAEIELTGFFSQLTAVARTGAFVALLEANTALSAAVVKQVDVSSALTATASIDANAIRIRTGESSLTADIALTAEAFKVRAFDIALSSTVEFTAAAQAERNYSAVLTSEFSQQASAVLSSAGIANLSVTASVTAAVLRTRSAAAQVQCEFTQTSSAVRTARTPVTLESSVTFSSEIGLRQSANAVLEIVGTFAADVEVIPPERAEADLVVASELSIVIGAVKAANISTTAIATQLTATGYNATGTVLMESTATLTALIGVIKQYPKRRLLSVGNTADFYHIYQIPALPGGEFAQEQIFSFGDDLATVSLWVKTRTSGGLFDPLISNNSTSGSTGGALTYLNGLTGDVALRDNFDPDEPITAWNVDAVQDTEWHHILLRRGGVGSTAGNEFSLWVDGEPIGRAQGYNLSLDFSTGSQVYIGDALLRALTVAYALGGYRHLADFAQLWMGYTPTSTFNSTLFYDQGIVDLAADGRGLTQQLPLPAVYSLLTPTSDQVFAKNDSGTTSALAGQAFLPLPDMPAEFDLTFAPQVVFVFDIELTSNTALSLIPTKISRNGADLTAVTAQTTAILGNFTGLIAANVISSVEAIAVITASGAAELTIDSAVISNVSYTRGAALAISSSFSLTAEAEVIFPTRGEAALTSTFELEVDGTTFSGIALIAFANCSLTAEAEVIPPTRGEAALSSTFELTAVIGLEQQAISLQVNAATLSASAVIVASAVSTLSSSAELTSAPGKFTGIGLTNLQVNAFTLTVGGIINFDTALTLRIAQETRELRPLAESRELDIIEETRLNIIIKG